MLRKVDQHRKGYCLGCRRRGKYYHFQPDLTLIEAQPFSSPFLQRKPLQNARKKVLKPLPHQGKSPYCIIIFRTVLFQIKHKELEVKLLEMNNGQSLEIRIHHLLT